MARRSYSPAEVQVETYLRWFGRPVSWWRWRKWRKELVRDDRPGGAVEGGPKNGPAV